MHIERERERERKKERERETETERERQNETQIERERERETQSERDTPRDARRFADSKTCASTAIGQERLRLQALHGLLSTQPTQLQTSVQRQNAAALIRATGRSLASVCVGELLIHDPTPLRSMRLYA